MEDSNAVTKSMFLALFISFLLLLCLFLLSHKIATYFFLLIFLLTKNKNLAIWLLAFVLLPGTIIHEVSHFLLASLLRVPTGELSVFPQITPEGQVRAGKLMLGKVDPFRHVLIGLAPLLGGLALIYFLGHFFLATFPASFYPLSAKTGLGLYFLFVISTTMFSSKKDLEELLIVAPIVFLIFSALRLIGLRVFLETNALEKITVFLQELNLYLVLASTINFLVLSFLGLNLFGWQKILKKKIIEAPLISRLGKKI